MPSSLRNHARRIGKLVDDRAGWIGPTVVRITLGLVFMSTGWGKLHGHEKIVDFFTQLHIPLPGFNAWLVAGTEFFGGLAILLGLGTRLLALPLAFTMVIAIVTAKRAEVDGVTTLLGFEEWSYLVMFLWLAVRGPGPVSVDRLIVGPGAATAARELCPA